MHLSNIFLTLLLYQMKQVCIILYNPLQFCFFSCPNGILSRVVTKMIKYCRISTVLVILEWVTRIKACVIHVYAALGQEQKCIMNDNDGTNFSPRVVKFGMKSTNMTGGYIAAVNYCHCHVKQNMDVPITFLVKTVSIIFLNKVKLAICHGYITRTQIWNDN